MVASDNVAVKAMWRNAPAPGKVNVIFNANGGSGTMATQQVEKNSNYTLPACGYTAPEGKEFDKWSVTVGTAAAVSLNPRDRHLTREHVPLADVLAS